MGQTRTGSNNLVVGDEHEFKVTAGWLRDSPTQSAALTPRCPVVSLSTNVPINELVASWSLRNPPETRHDGYHVLPLAWL